MGNLGERSVSEGKNRTLSGVGLEEEEGLDATSTEMKTTEEVKGLEEEEAECKTVRDQERLMG